jgi:hypothetical protein
MTPAMMLTRGSPAGSKKLILSNACSAETVTQDSAEGIHGCRCTLIDHIGDPVNCRPSSSATALQLSPSGAACSSTPMQVRSRKPTSRSFHNPCQRPEDMRRQHLVQPTARHGPGGAPACNLNIRFTQAKVEFCTVDCRRCRSMAPAQAVWTP